MRKRATDAVRRAQPHVSQVFDSSQIVGDGAAQVAEAPKREILQRTWHLWKVTPHHCIVDEQTVEGQVCQARRYRAGDLRWADVQITQIREVLDRVWYRAKEVASVHGALVQMPPLVGVYRRDACGLEVARLVIAEAAVWVQTDVFATPGAWVRTWIPYVAWEIQSVLCGVQLVHGGLLHHRLWREGVRRVIHKQRETALLCCTKN